MTSEKEVIW